MLNKILRAFLILFLSGQTAACAFNSTDAGGGNIHDQITREALKGVFSEANLKIIIDANTAQDRAGSESVLELRRHFADERFVSSIGYIDREKKRALNYACESDTDPQQRGRALVHFGEMLHCVQDFYSRTNYLELIIALESKNFDPYEIPLVDWAKVPDGYPGLVSSGGAGGQDAADISKESKESRQGKKIAGARITYFHAARELAVRETQRQWTSFETMIRNRCGQRAAAIIAALKEASPDLKLLQE